METLFNALLVTKGTDGQGSGVLAIGKLMQKLDDPDVLKPHEMAERSFRLGMPVAEITDV